MISEKDYVLKEFGKRFAGSEDLRFLVHGSREYAAAILDAYADRFRFDALTTFDGIGEERFRGVPVISRGEAARQIADGRFDAVLLTERVKYAEEAYEDLEAVCREHGVQIRNMYGVDELLTHDLYRTSRYLTTNELRRIADAHDVLAFEFVSGFYRVTEGRLSEPDPRMVKLCRYAAARGKTVLFSLRRSWPAEEQIRLLEEALEQAGIDLPGPREDHLIFREGEDLSFRKTAGKYPGMRICYFGQGLVNEFILPRAYGIRTYRVGDEVVNEYSGSYRDLTRRPDGLALPERPTRDGILEKASAYDVISFDLFDTLLIRKVLYPEDVFHLTEDRARKLLRNMPENFFDLRVRVSRALPCADIDTWYEEIAAGAGLQPEDAAALKELELDTERHLLTVRRSVAELMRILHDSGKTVFLISDMYIPEDRMRRLLADLGITSYDRLFVSCDYGRFKSGGLFRDALAAAGPGRRMLHIGDNAEADGRAAAAENIDHILLPAPFRMAVEAGWLTTIECAVSLTDRCLLGLCAASCFEDPFLPADRGTFSPDEKTAYFAYATCAPVLAGYLTYLAGALKEAARQGRPFSRLLLSARDGWLLKDVYRLLRRLDGERSPEGPALPPETYFYCSRHSSFLTCEDREDLVTAAAASFPKQHAEELLRGMYEIAPAAPDRSAADPRTGEDGGASPASREDADPWAGDVGRLRELFRENLPAIRASAETQRRNNRRYLKNEGIDPGEHMAFMDFVSAGNTQYFLQKGLGLDLTGFFVGLPSYSRYMDDPPVCGYFLTGEYNNAFQLFNSYMEMEYIMTSPEPSVDRFDGNGRPVFAGETRTAEELEKIGRITDRIRKFLTDWLQLFYEDGAAVSAEMVEELYDAAGIQGIAGQAYDDWSKTDIE
ncbi:MAG: hypothetical protein IIY36_06845 [Lachnospiraceae bacterium]|nr:hypothetical protein [Lachnospiraceae bacterium]